MRATEHDVDIGWIRLLACLSPLTISSGYLLRHGREPGERLWIAGFATLFILSLVSLARAWRRRIVIRVDDEGIRLFPSPPGWFDRFRGSSDEVPPIPWSRVRSMRFESPTIERPSERTLLFDTEDGERHLVLVGAGARLKDPPELLAALRSRGWDLTWPEDPRWEIISSSG